MWLENVGSPQINLAMSGPNEWSFFVVAQVVPIQKSQLSLCVLFGKKSHWIVFECNIHIDKVLFQLNVIFNLTAQIYLTLLMEGILYFLRYIIYSYINLHLQIVLTGFLTRHIKTKGAILIQWNTNKWPGIISIV